MSPTFIAPQENALFEFLRRQSFNAKDLQGFTAIVDQIKTQTPENVRLEIADRLRKTPPTADHIRLNSVLFYLTGDLYYLERIIHFYMLAGDQVGIDKLHYAYWCMTRQMFLGKAEPPKTAAFGVCDLHRFYDYLLTAIETRWDLRPEPMSQRRMGPVSRAVFVTNQFIGENHQPSRDCFDFARLMQDNHDLDVLILNTNLLPTEISSTFVPPFTATLMTMFKDFQVVNVFGDLARMVSYTETAFTRAKLEAILRTIGSFSPDVVVGFGGGNVIADLIARARACPVVAIPSTTGPMHSMADIILGFDRNDWTAQVPAIYRRPYAGRFRPFTFGYSLPPLKPETANYDLPEDAPIVAVVGTRLDLEVTPEFFALLETILDRRPNAVVAFAGEAPVIAARAAKSRHAARFRALGHVHDIRSFYRRCALFLNPPRQGGGGGVAYALAEGLPVVATPQGDGASVAGNSFHVADMTEMLDKTLALLDDPALRAAAGERAKARFAEIGDRNRSVAELLAYCNALAGGGGPG